MMTTSTARSALTFFTVPLSVSIHRSEWMITRSLLAAAASHESRLRARLIAMPACRDVGRIASQGWLAEVPVCYLLVGMRHLEDGRLVEGLPDELEPDRQASFCEPTRDRHAGQARQIDRDREDVREVHLERVLGLLPNLECRRRRGGRGNHLTPFERMLEISADQRSHLLRLEVVGVV